MTREILVNMQYFYSSDCYITVFLQFKYLNKSNVAPVQFHCYKFAIEIVKVNKYVLLRYYRQNSVRAAIYSIIKRNFSPLFKAGLLWSCIIRKLNKNVCQERLNINH